MIRFRLAERIADKEFTERRTIQLLEIAAESGVGRMTLSKLLNHHGASIRTEYLDKLCRYFECRVEDLVEYVPDRGLQTGAATKVVGPPKEGKAKTVRKPAAKRR